MAVSILRIRDIVSSQGRLSSAAPCGAVFGNSRLAAVYLANFPSYASFYENCVQVIKGTRSSYTSLLASLTCTVVLFTPNCREKRMKIGVVDLSAFEENEGFRRIGLTSLAMEILSLRSGRSATILSFKCATPPGS
ncbi:hypothetical protein DIPPA_56428 [Diplonema papillatum]|nr:hypothetical protein DIPPA_56428 [Diplonema papillatum]